VTEPTDQSGPGVTWDGNFYPVDPGEITLGEYTLVAQRSDVKGYRDMGTRLRNLDHEAWRALFWVHARRRDPDLKWSDFMGPPFKVIIQAAESWPTPDDEDGEPGKAQEEPSETTG
jgi:hypothetical protein